MRYNLTANAAFVLALAVSAHAVTVDIPDRSEPYGIGINLSFDYGTISVEYPNRTIVDIASINGNSAYRSMMLSNMPHTIPEPSLDYGLVLQAKSERDTLVDRVRRIWRSNTSKKAQPIEGMYRSLTVAAEAYLDTGIRQAVVTVPYDMSADLQDQLLTSAKALSIDVLMFPNHPAAEFASFAYGQGRGRRGPDQETITLAIDYNSACLSAILSHEGNGFKERYETMYNTTLGLSSRPSFNQLEAALEQIVGAIPDQASCPLISLALSGAAAADRTLEVALQMALRRYFDSCPSALDEDAPDMDIPPLYAASRGGAELCAQRMLDESATQLDL